MHLGKHERLQSRWTVEPALIGHWAVLPSKGQPAGELGIAHPMLQFPHRTAEVQRQLMPHLVCRRQLFGASSPMRWMRVTSVKIGAATSFLRLIASW